MRTMIRVQLPVEAGNKGIQDGSLPALVQGFVEEVRPEAAYFMTLDGKRTALFVVDMEGSHQMPILAERFFFGMNAAVDFWPVMNAEELRQGLMGLKL